MFEEAGPMIQATVKKCFVERYCHPSSGWHVFVDIDASEEGRTGSDRKSPEAQERLARMLTEAPVAIRDLNQLGAHVGQRGEKWRALFGKNFTLPKGDRDIIAVHPRNRLVWVVEVEGDSAGQPEGKIYKALGQLICAVTEFELPDYKSCFSLVVWGKTASTHLRRARAAERLGISGLALSSLCSDDHWVFGTPGPLEAPANLTRNAEELR